MAYLGRKARLICEQWNGVFHLWYWQTSGLPHMIGSVRIRAHGTLLHLHQNPPKPLKQIPGAAGGNWVCFRCTLLVLPKPVTCLTRGWTCIELHNLFALSAFQTMAKALNDAFQQNFFFPVVLSVTSLLLPVRKTCLRSILNWHFKYFFFFCQVCRKRLKQLIGDVQEIHIFYSSVGKTWDFLTMPRDRCITALHCTAVFYITWSMLSATFQRDP